MANEMETYKSNLMSEIHLLAEQNGNMPREEFITQITENLIDAEEFLEFIPLQFESVGSRNSKIQIDGYFYDNLENCLALFICDFVESDEVDKLTNTEAVNLFKREQNFIVNSLNGFILEKGEPSNQGYDLAYDICNRFKNVDKYRMYIISNRVMSTRVRKFENDILCGKECEYTIWDMGRLYELAKSKSGREEVEIHLADFGAAGIPCLKAGQSSEYTAFLCNIPGKILADLYNEYGGRLLEGNVRSFLSTKGKINKQIRNTILNDPKKFFAYNNGIAATASYVKTEMTPYGLLLTDIRDLQIVNGGQTTASLANALVKDKDRANGLKDIYVPMKLSVVEPETAARLIPDIARYANSQNKVSEADFFSNSPFHIQMEQISRKLLAPAVNGNQYGTHWYYERARGQYRQETAGMTPVQKKRFEKENPKKQVITKTDMAKFYNIYSMKPDSVSTGAQKNFIKFAGWASEQWDKDKDQFNEQFYKNIVAVDILFQSVDGIVKRSSWYDGGYKAQVNTYALSWLFWLIHQQCPNKEMDLKKIWQKQEVSSETEKQLSRLAQVTYEFLTSPDRGVQNVTEWAKRAECWAKMKKMSFALHSAFVEELIDIEIVKHDEQEAKKEQKEINKANAMIDTVQYGIDKWEKVIAWTRTNPILTPKETSILTSCVQGMKKGRIPTDRQCVCLMEILKKARDESYPD
ncbi:AIPR family protein [Acidaminococcus fermentans]|jgi:hypothetical protein|uniref:AIPR family protein n=1 Tax=Acidaminococcus fermentans TaxID=905 RepID=A0A6N7VN82_ACIFE|nr:AIPR family protein [Acidaminococcus fermentans]MSS83137.1 AIPR family protein [Acidaminococcus fermentans]